MREFYIKKAISYHYFAKKQKNEIAMPRLMLTDQQTQVVIHPA